MPKKRSKRDATVNLEPGDETQRTDKKLKIGLLPDDGFFATLKKAAQPDPKK